MAKGSQNGVLKGKRGNTVFYKIANSNNKEKQGSREYTAEVSNPKTIGQAIQRLKLTPIMRFYSAFKEDVLNHSWENVEYGGQSMRTFMKKAFQLTSGYPFVSKGFSAPAPAEYEVSSGALGTIQYEFQDKDGLICPILSTDAGPNFSDYCKQIIQLSNGQVQNGDQITIMTLEGNNVNYAFPKVVRFIIDTESTGTMDAMMDEKGIIISVDGLIEHPGRQCFGGAVILSRPVISQTNGAITWKRSTQRFAVNYFLPQVEALFTQDYYNEAVKSYMPSSTRTITSSWYLNQGKTLAGDTAIPEAPISLKAIMIQDQFRNDELAWYGKYGIGIQLGSQKLLIAGNGSTHEDEISFYAAVSDNSQEPITTVRQDWKASFVNRWNLNNLIAGTSFTGFISWSEAEALAPGGVTFIGMEEPPFNP